MGFVFSADREVEWPVTISTPADGGATERTEITARFRLATGEDFERLRGAAVQSMVAAQQGKGFAPQESAQTLLAEHILDWFGIEDEVDGSPIPCDDNAKGALLDIPYLYNAFSAALLQASSGARAKN